VVHEETARPNAEVQPQFRRRNPNRFLDFNLGKVLNREDARPPRQYRALRPLKVPCPPKPGLLRRRDKYAPACRAPSSHKNKASREARETIRKCEPGRIPSAAKSREIPEKLFTERSGCGVERYEN